jgi:hypothetical protein
MSDVRSAKVRVFNELHEAKLFDPMDWTLAGTVNDVRALAPLNTLSAMVATFDPTVKLVIPLQPWKANEPIERTSLVITTDRS